MHERTAIRHAVVATLKGVAPAFATAARDRVYATRLSPARLAELPAINVYVDDEESEPKGSAPRELERRAVVAVEAWVVTPANGAVDDELDALALQIETAMDRNPHLTDTVFDAALVSTVSALKIDGDRPMGCVHLEFAVTYHTDPRVADLTDDFLTADVQMNGAHDIVGVQ